MLVVILIIVAIVAALAVWFISIYNNIVTKDNRCDNAWQTIDASTSGAMTSPPTS